MNIECVNREATTLSQIKVGGFFEKGGVLYLKRSGVLNDGCFSCIEIASQSFIYLRKSSMVVPAIVMDIRYKVVI